MLLMTCLFMTCLHLLSWVCCCSVWELFTGLSAFRNLHYGAVVQRVVVAGVRPPVPPEAPDAYCLLMTQ
jgi:hypothetical protein